MNESTKPSAYVSRLPIGKQIPAEALVDDDLFPLEGVVRTKRVEEPRLPEPIRHGAGGIECSLCSADQADTIWEDERWRVLMRSEPHALPMVAVLQPKAHHDLEDLPPELLAGLGTMLQRVSRAIGRLDDVGRVHVNRWGDGSEHFHVWFLARPLGMWQMRGAMLAIWDDLLPKVPEDEWETNRRTVAAALATDGGKALA